MVPNIFGFRDWFHGRHFFHGQEGEFGIDGFRMKVFHLRSSGISLILIRSAQPKSVSCTFTVRFMLLRESNANAIWREASSDSNAHLPPLTSCGAARFLTGQTPASVCGPAVGHPWLRITIYRDSCPSNISTMLTRVNNAALDIGCQQGNLLSLVSVLYSPFFNTTE